MPGQVAARWAGWARSHANLPGPLHGASPIGGVPFLTDVLGANARLIVEAAFGADLSADPASWNWYDITGDVRQADGQRVDISPVGRGDETSTAQPAGCSFQLDNEAGDYTAYSSTSRWWPNVRRNTPIRVSVNLTGQAADTSVRFQGYANGFVPSWDISANLAVVSVSASGVSRRLGQGKGPVRSPLSVYTPTTSPVAYWPLDDGKDVTALHSAVSGVPDMDTPSLTTLTGGGDRRRPTSPRCASSPRSPARTGSPVPSWT
jgi:hypothetical protein